jgi:hypothetical protein
MVLLPSLWVAYCLAVTGHPLPATFYVKHADGGLAAFADVGVLWRMVWGLPWFAWGGGVVLFAVGATHLLRRREPVGLLVVAMALVLPLGAVWAHELKDWWPFYWSRYFMPAIPFLLVPIAVTVPAIVDAVRARRLLPAALGVAAALLTLLPWSGHARAAADLYAWNCQNIDEVQGEVARWLRAHAEPDDVVATHDAGIIRFLGHRRVFDLVGLNTHEVVFGDRMAALRRAQPTWFALFPTWYPEAEAAPNLHVVHRVQSPRYTICNCRGDVMLVLARTRRATPPAARR